MPTADILQAGEAALEYESDGRRLLGDDCNHWALLEVGLLDRAEIGVDRCFAGETTTSANAKVLLQREDESRPAVAVGVQGLGEGERAQPFLALAKDLGAARLHVGGIRLEGQAALMLGVEQGFAAPVALVADHITGSESVSGLGLAVDLTDRFSIFLSRIFAHSEEGEDGWQVTLTFGGAVPL